MVDAAVSYAIGKLGDFLVKEVNIRTGVKNAIIWLKVELGYMQVSVRALEEALDAKKEIGHVRLWINEVKDVANEAVIILERFSFHQEEHAAQKHGVLDHMRTCICICNTEANLYDIGNDIESLKERFGDIKTRRDEYHINDILASVSQNQKQERRIKGVIPFENEVDVVGFEDDVKTLLAELLRDNPSLSVTSIHGMGGLGKTTLARKLYDSSKLRHFKSRGFVSVSKEYDIKDVLRRMIKSFKGYMHHELDLLKMDELDLLQHLRELLDADRYLVVIDDLWDIEAWKNIRKAFPEKKNGSRVIITTRNKSIAQRVDDRCFVHELHFLREDESWQLFSKSAKPSQNLDKLGKEMVSKCQGLPLAIVVLGGLLLHKESYEDWSDVKDHLWTKLKDRSLEIKEILSLSYDDLSFQMRQCFLYLARFPEDHMFKVDTLMKLWIAEEFITEADEKDGVVMEDVAKDCLNELINRNLIQIAELEVNQEVVECRVHDLVRDLTIQKATEQKLLGFFDSSKQHTSSISLLQGQPRHAIYNGFGEYSKLLGPSFDVLKLRSLAIIKENDRVFKLEDMKLIYTRFIVLKVLDLTGVEESEVIPKEIGDLVLLKFLGLMSCNYRQRLVIPPSIHKLKTLQTLSGSTSCAYEFPREICELKELRHLKFGVIRSKRRSSTGSLKICSQQAKIQSIDSIWYEDWIEIDSTSNFKNLHTLYMQADSTPRETALNSIANLTSLRKFVLYFGRYLIPSIKPLSSCKRLKTVSLMGEIKNPVELRYLPYSVTCLTLGDSNFTQDPMPTLGTLPNLTSLHLMSIWYHGTKMFCGYAAFPCLQFLILRYFPSLEELQVEGGGLPSLTGFHIQDCPKLVISPQLKLVPALPNIIIFREF